ncbi:unnamed protein product [Ceratitis capitata]|uniref:(Mediterranean fruit fly) hypothetical protein n=1 Tax=Ceratitis capitata TaxID=7213 RepID=A0A811USH8_CERCA|nr:unnamed protein product [Ceratitis capitata]
MLGNHSDQDNVDIKRCNNNKLTPEFPQILPHEFEDHYERYGSHYESIVMSLPQQVQKNVINYQSIKTSTTYCYENSKDLPTFDKELLRSTSEYQILKVGNNNFTIISSGYCNEMVGTHEKSHLKHTNSQVNNNISQTLNHQPIERQKILVGDATTETNSDTRFNTLRVIPADIADSVDKIPNGSTTDAVNYTVNGVNMIKNSTEI